MLRRSRSRLVLAVAFAGLLALGAACGEDDGGVITGGTGASTTAGGEPTTTAGGGPIPVEQTELTVERIDLGETATLRCTDTAEGTAWLADPAAAAAACELVMGNPDAQRLLTEPPATDRMCTEIYGGPEEAIVTGRLQDGRTVDASFNRTNGCGIGDWELLQDLLGRPGT